MLLNVDRILSLAERSFLLEGMTEYFYVIREDKSVPNYFEKVERELKSYPYFKINDHKRVKEGLVNVVRPYKIRITASELEQLKPEFKLVKTSFDELASYQARFPLSDFIKNNFSLCYRSHDRFKSCLDVYLYLIANRDLLIGMLPRQIPHNSSTKIIGEEALLLALFCYEHKIKGTWEDFYNYFRLSERSTEFRIYTPRCHWRGTLLQEFHGIVSVDYIDLYDFTNLKNTLVIENLESFLSLVSSSKDTLLIFGSGWKCTQLNNIINKLPGKVYYWGDIDKEGIEIASQFCDISAAIPVGMDLDTLESHQHLCQDISYATPPKRVALLQDIYEEVCRRQIRIEQEKLKLDWLSIFGTSI